MLNAVQRGCFAAVLATACVIPVLTAHAVPFDSAISIDGTVSLNIGSSLPSFGNATQSGTLSVISGGVLTSSTFTNLTVSGSNPITQGLTDIGDKLGIRFLSGSTYDGNPAGSDFLLGDYTISLSNSSATDTFEITLGLLFSAQNLLATGFNAYINGDFLLNDASSNPVAQGRHTRDTLFGDEDIALTPTSFLVALAPGQSATFGGTLTLMGGVFADGEDNVVGAYNGGFDAQIFIAGVRQLGSEDPQTQAQVPVPGTAALLALGLAFMTVRRRPRNGSDQPAS